MLCVEREGEAVDLGMHGSPGHTSDCINHGRSHGFLWRGQPRFSAFLRLGSRLRVGDRGCQAAWPAWRPTESGNTAASSILSLLVIEVNNVDEQAFNVRNRC